MKKIFCLFFLIFASSWTLQAQSTPIDSSQMGDLSIVSWNIQMLPNFFRAFSSSLRKKQALRQAWIVDYIKENNHDVWVLQEVFDIEIKKRLRRQLRKDFPYCQMPINKGRMTSNGIMVLSKYPMKYLGHVVYAKGVSSDGMAAKGCVLVQVEKDGQSYQVAGTHLQSGGREDAQQHRNQQYLDIRTLIDQHQKEGVPQIVLGDMNTQKTATEHYERMLKSLDVIDYPLNEQEPYTVDGNNSWNNHEHGQQIDYVFLRPNQSTATIIQQKVIRPFKQYKGARMDLADHYGVLSFVKR